MVSLFWKTPAEHYILYNGLMVNICLLLRYVLRLFSLRIQSKADVTIIGFGFEYASICLCYLYICNSENTSSSFMCALFTKPMQWKLQNPRLCYWTFPCMMKQKQQLSFCLVIKRKSSVTINQCQSSVTPIKKFPFPVSWTWIVDIRVQKRKNLSNYHGTVAWSHCSPNQNSSYVLDWFRKRSFDISL